MIPATAARSADIFLRNWDRGLDSALIYPLQSTVVDCDAGKSVYALQYAWDRMMRAAHDACSGQRISFIPHSFLLQISEALKAAVEALSTSSEAISALVFPEATIETLFVVCSSNCPMGPLRNHMGAVAT